MAEKVGMRKPRVRMQVRKGTGTYFPVDNYAESVEGLQLLPDLAGKMSRSPTERWDEDFASAFGARSRTRQRKG